MRYLLISAAAVMAIAGASALGNAQAPDGDKAKGPGSGAAQREPARGERGQQPTPNRAEPKSQMPKGAQKQPGKDEPRAKTTQGPASDKAQSKPSGQADRGTDQNRRKAEQREPGKDQRKAAESRSPQDKKAADQREPGKDKQKSATPGQPDSAKKAAEQQSGKDRTKSAGRDGKQDRVQVSEQQRTSVRERLVKENRVERVKRTNINVTINVGARVPRSVRIHTLPVAIVSLAPAYRSYSYFVLEDETICIVDPQTYVIVDVIPVGTQRADRPARMHLALSNDDMRFIYRTVPRNRTANVRIRLALGAEVPRDVELLAFPADVVSRVPNVERYRYIVTDGDIVIVDPNDYDVALVINE